MHEKSRDILYEKDTALRSALRDREQFTSITDDREGYERALKNVRATPNLERFANTENGHEDVAILRLWQTYLVKYGRGIDRQIDALTADIIVYGDAWWNNKKQLAQKLQRLQSQRKAIRNYEDEVEDFVLFVTTRSGVVDEFANVPLSVLNELHGTYNRAFDLCVFKLNSINTGRVTATNLGLSVLALFVAVASFVVAVLTL